MDYSFRKNVIKKRPIHILVRYSDKLNKTYETIPEHQRVIEKDGSVWFGKLGRPVSQNHIERINQQVTNGIPTFLYLVQRVGPIYESFCGSIIHITKTYPKEERNLIPEYYYLKKIINQVSMWTKLSKLEQTDKGVLGKLVVATSGMPILESLPTSMAAHFIIQESLVLQGQ